MVVARRRRAPGAGFPRLAHAARAGGFAILSAVVYPLLLVGASFYLFTLSTRNRGISGTACEPLFTRLLLHGIGARDDAAAAALALHLPALSPAVRGLLIEPLTIAARVSRFRGSFLTCPAPPPSTVSRMVNHRPRFFDAALATAIEPARIRCGRW